MKTRTPELNRDVLARRLAEASLVLASTAAALDNLAVGCAQEREPDTDSSTYGPDVERIASNMLALGAELSSLVDQLDQPDDNTGPYLFH